MVSSPFRPRVLRYNFAGSRGVVPLRRCSSAAEQGSHKPRVGGSIPPTATTLFELLHHLLVQEAGDDEPHHRHLARRQRLEALAQLFSLGVLRARDTVLIERLLDGIEK